MLRLTGVAVKFQLIVLVVALATAGLWAGSLSASGPGEPEVGEPNFSLGFTAYNASQLTAILPGGSFAQYVRAGDYAVLVSGNNANTLNVPWVNASAASLKAAYPLMPVVVVTAGLTNVATLAASASGDITGIGYVYEPNMANEPEFSWDAATTYANMRTLHETVAPTGRASIAMPTGRATIDRDHAGDFSYGEIGLIADEQIAQLQRSIADGNGIVAAAGVAAQIGTPRFAAQVTVDTTTGNGTDAWTAYRWAREATEYVESVVLWWAPGQESEAVDFLKLRHGGRAW